MTIRVVCQKCGAKLDIREELAGSTRRCPKCKTEFTVPPADDELDDGVSLGGDDDEPAESVATHADSVETDTKEAPIVPAPSAAVKQAAAATDDDDEADDDDDGDDYMPSFVTAPVKDKPEKKKAPPGASTEDDDDDEPVFSIPKAPVTAKPKFKPFDPEEFTDEPPRSNKKREIPASLQERPRQNRLSDDDMDAVPDSRGKGPRSGRGSDFNLPSPGTSGAPDSGAAIPTTGTKDRAQAARELRQALKDSALKAPPETDTGRGFGFDFSAFMSEIGLKGLAIIVGIILVGPALYLVSDSMMGSKSKIPKLAYVSGIVTYNGAPAVGAMVNFQPVVEQNDPEANKKKHIRTSFGQTDDKGHYKLMYMEGIQGVAIGKCRVTLILQPPMVVPAEYSQGSFTVKEVAAGSHTVDFPLTADVKKK